MLDINKHFKFDFDRKLKPNFLTWLPNGKIEKTTVYLMFSLFIQFSVKEIRHVFSYAIGKAYDNIKLITMARKKGGVPMFVGELSPFFN